MDALSKKVLKYMINTSKTTDFVWSFSDIALYECKSTIDEMSADLHTNTEDIRACIRFLMDCGYIEPQIAISSSEKKTVGFHLSHKGLHYQYFRKQEIKKYIAEKWIDFFSLLLSIIAVLVSAIALVQS